MFKTSLFSPPDCTAPCSHPEWNGCDSDTNWWGRIRRIHASSSWPAAPDSEEPPHQVGTWVAQRWYQVLTLLEESAIPDACCTCHKTLNVSIASQTHSVFNIRLNCVTSIQLIYLVVRKGKRIFFVLKCSNLCVLLGYGTMVRFLRE